MLTFNGSGVLLSREISLGQAPNPVQETIKTTVATSKLISICKNLDTDKNTYDVIMQLPDGRQCDFCVGEGSKLLSEQQFLNQLPNPAQKTITAYFAGGHIIHIERSHEVQAGVMPYVVLGHKEGKDYVVSIGPRGAFLGVDQ